MNQHGEAQFDPQAARLWLDVLYPGDTPGLIHISATGNWHGCTFTDRDQAVEYMAAMDGREGTYLRATTLRARPAAGDRGGAADSLALPGLWADLDIDGPGHKHELCPADCPKGHQHITRPLPPDEAAARQIITESGLPAPSLWVHSGGGLYPWWLLDPHVEVDGDNLAGLQKLSQQWQNVIGRSAVALGWHYGTGVGDLARVLRAPGTVNRKEGLARACRIIEAEGTAFTLDELHAGLAVAVTRHPEPVRVPSPAATTPSGAPRLEVVRSPGEISPNDDFEARVSWDDELLLGDWTVTKGVPGGYCEWRRPGKDTEGISATTGFDPGRDRLKVFTDASDFTQGEVYTKPGAYAVLHHAGDHRAATRELARLGFGTPRPPYDPAAEQRAAIADLLPPGSPALRRLEVVDGTSALKVQPAEKVGGELPSPNQPLAVARQLVARMTTPRCWWRGDFYEHQGAHWNVVESTVIDNWIYQQTEHASYASSVDAKGNVELRPWAPTKRKVNDVAHALGVGALHRTGEPDKVIAITNGVLSDVHNRTLLPHDPSRFNLFSLPFAYDPDATCPQWHAFLESVLPDDQQAHDFIGEWFGYVLSGRTEQQKMAALIGERRSGKGTIARVLGAMLGKENVAGLDLNLLASQFGLENMIGKSLAVAGDVRWHSRNVGDAVPILLRIIGNDVIDVHRKNRAAWNGELPVRIMMMSNDTPTFSDRSGALGGRMIYVKFSQSFYGREDPSLTEKLLDELPGILNWALDGLDRLNGRGRFTEPDSGQAEAEAVRRLSDPIGAFVEDWCVIDPVRHIELDSLFLRYRAWCESEGRTKDSTTKEIFSRDLRTKVPGLTTKRERINGKQIRILLGIGSDTTGSQGHGAF
jgi:putative DNA primase/helicase